MKMTNKNCPKCKGTGVVKEADGSIHTCWDCLQDGNMDQHSKNLKEANIKV
jgi:ribosomal protein L37AE/L43A